MPDAHVVHNGVDVARWRPGPRRRAAGVVRAHRAREGPAPRDRRRGARRPAAACWPGRSPTARYFERRGPAPARAPGHRVRRAPRPTPSSTGSSARPRAALVTPCWDEPYGLVVAEALACGTPVCALRARRAARAAARGLRHGSSPPATSTALAGGDRGRAAALAAPRRASTRVRTCSLERMVDRYAELYGVAGRRAASRDRLLRPPPRRRARDARRERSPRTSAASASPGSARARGPAAGRGQWMRARARRRRPTPTRGPDRRRRAALGAAATIRGCASGWRRSPPGSRRRRAAAGGRRRVRRGRRRWCARWACRSSSWACPGDASRRRRTSSPTGWPTAILAPVARLGRAARRRRARGARRRTRSARSRASTAARGRRLAAPGGRRRRVLVLSGRGGTELTAEQLAAAAGARPRTGSGPCSARPATAGWPTRGRCSCGADVVVTHAGQNAIAEVAAARRPAVVVPQARPHDEQRATAAALPARRPGRGTRPRWPAARDWPRAARGGRAPRRRAAGRAGATGAGGRRAADVLERRAAPRRGGRVRTAVITIVAGRHDHLRAQHAALRRRSPPPHGTSSSRWAPARRARCRAACGGTAEVIAVERPARRAAACPGAQRRRRARPRRRRRAARLPRRRLHSRAAACCARYREAARPGRRGAALRPGRLPAPRAARRLPGDGSRARSRAPHPARPVAAGRRASRGGDHALFWSLSFAVTRATWRRDRRVLRGRTSATAARTPTSGSSPARAGRRPRAGSAARWAYHQHHPAATPPVQHLRRHPAQRRASSATAGAGGRCRAGWRRSPSAASPTTTRPRTPGDARGHARAAERQGGEQAPERRNSHGPARVSCPCAFSSRRPARPAISGRWSPSPTPSGAREATSSWRRAAPPRSGRAPPASRCGRSPTRRRSSATPCSPSSATSRSTRRTRAGRRGLRRHGCARGAPGRARRLRDVAPGRGGLGAERVRGPGRRRASRPSRGHGLDLAVRPRAPDERGDGRCAAPAAPRPCARRAERGRHRRTSR